MIEKDTVTTRILVREAIKLGIKTSVDLESPASTRELLYPQINAGLTVGSPNSKIHSTCHPSLGLSRTSMSSEGGMIAAKTACFSRS